MKESVLPSEVIHDGYFGSIATLYIVVKASKLCASVIKNFTHHPRYVLRCRNDYYTYINTEHQQQCADTWELCQRQLSWGGTNNSIPWNTMGVISCLCPWYRLLSSEPCAFAKNTGFRVDAVLMGCNCPVSALHFPPPKSGIQPLSTYGK